MSLNMLIETEHGFDYTAADCMGWMTDAGFSRTRAEHLVGPDSMVIGVKEPVACSMPASGPALRPSRFRVISPHYWK